ncbi:hypothetical protein [Guptibacillus spartinae]|uniref:hypothetical protein n=1 Tax=Guptibacillus spartinae TaxID=3025679 RepID=UPI002360DF58|nr:hypothetical protein [Pseudalkalibacillus spartinae]
MLIIATSQVETKEKFPFSRRQTFIITIIGLVFWFLGAMTVQLGGRIGLFGGLAGIGAFVLGMLFAWYGVKLIIFMCKLVPKQYVPATAFGLAVATFCDGICITWLTPIYGTEWKVVGLGAAWILWGACTFLTSAFLQAYRK